MRPTHGAESSGPRPIVILVLLLACILILGAAFAAIKVFVIGETHECALRGPLPDPICTPGVGEDIPLEKLCAVDYAKSVRDVPQELKERVFKEYHVAERNRGEYEVDHLISPALGGTNYIENLFPAAEPMSYKEKEVIERKLRDAVCSGKMALRDAQRIIATNWTVMLAEE